MKTIICLFSILFTSGLNSSRAQNTWMQKADFGGTARSHAVAFSIGSKGYMGTGRGPNYNNFGDFWEYDPSTNAWTQEANFGGTARSNAVGFSIGNKGYIGTGWDNQQPPVGYTNDFWEYDPAANTWTQKANVGGGARNWAVGFSIGSKGYIGTGFDDSAPFNGRNDFWEYNPATDEWTQKANFGGTARYSAVGFSIDNKGYIGTGYDLYNFPSRNDFWEYDPSTNVWTQKADFGGTARDMAVGFSIGNKGYIGTGRSYPDVMNDFWQYDPAINTWTQKANVGGPTRYGAVGFSIGSKGYIGAGYYWTYIDDTDHDYKDFWEYTPECNGLNVYLDADSDGYGNLASSIFAANCIAPAGYVYNSTDCDDAIATIHPGRLDICNGIDDNCNGMTDESCGNTITTGSITGSPFCPVATVTVPFISSGTFPEGNVYTAELSDKNGNFTAPTVIGTLISTANSGTITAAIVSQPKAGKKYRVRVTSSVPVVTGANNGSKLQLIACDKPTALYVSDITATSATINWTGVPCAVDYQVQYRKLNTGRWVYWNVSANSSSIPNLVANTTYEVRVMTNCAYPSKSNWSPILTYSTTARLSSASESAEKIMSIYPNPSEEQTTIQFTLLQSSHVSIKVYDVSGKEIQTLVNDDLEQGEQSLLLNTNNFPKGVYIVKMISPAALRDGIENQKLIVQ